MRLPRPTGTRQPAKLVFNVGHVMGPTQTGPSGVSCFWLLLIFAEWPRRTPFSGAEKPPIAFICELKKQVRNGLLLRSEGQSAISDRAGAAHGISNPNATERGFKKKIGSGPSAGALCDRRDRPASLIARNSRFASRLPRVVQGPGASVSRLLGIGSTEQHHARNSRSVAKATQRPVTRKAPSCERRASVPRLIALTYRESEPG